MRRDRIGLVVTGTLLVGWLAWLGYLAATKTNPVVVSRSQVMASTHFVLAEVRVDPATGLPEREVHVVKDLRPAGDPLTGPIRVTNLKDARVAGGDGRFTDPGPYLLMLTRAPNNDQFVLTPPPLAPGHEGLVRPRPWAYVWAAPGVREQFDALAPKQPGG